jgi:hypothetical protein
VGNAFFATDTARCGRRLLAIRPDGRPTDPLFAADAADPGPAPPASTAN